MARRRNQVPAYLLHKPTGQARVRINGRDFYLGKYGSDDSRRKYGELVAKHCSGIPFDPLAGPGNDSGPTVSELLLAFKLHAESYYVKNGKPTSEVDCFYSVIRTVRPLFGATLVKVFTPMCLEACQAAFVQNGWTRKFCNKSVNRLRQIFKWGVAKGLVPVAVWQALTAVEPLKAGKTKAPDRPKRKAVPADILEAARARLCDEEQRFFDLLRYSGARPAELVGLQMDGIDQSGLIWTAELSDHKNTHLDKDRTLYFGPKCQEVLKRCPETGPLFSFKRDRFSTRLKAACLAAGVPPFVPYALRHTCATEARDTIGIESAQGLLGHSKPDMTTNYSRELDRLAREAARRIG